MGTCLALPRATIVGMMILLTKNTSRKEEWGAMVMIVASEGFGLPIVFIH